MNKRGQIGVGEGQFRLEGLLPSDTLPIDRSADRQSYHSGQDIFSQTKDAVWCNSDASGASGKVRFSLNLIVDFGYFSARGGRGISVQVRRWSEGRVYPVYTPTQRRHGFPTFPTRYSFGLLITKLSGRVGFITETNATSPSARMHALFSIRRENFYLLFVFQRIEF